MKRLFELQEDLEINEYANKAGAKHPARIKHVTRLHDLHRKNPSPGWCVRFLRKGKWVRRSSGFTDSACGSWAASLFAALDFAQRTGKQLGPRDTKPSNTVIGGLSKTVVHRGKYMYTAIVHNCAPRWVVFYGKNRTYEEALRIAETRIQKFLRKKPAPSQSNLRENTQ